MEADAVRKESIARGKSFCEKTKERNEKEATHLHELIVCVSSFHFRHKTLSIFYLVCVCVSVCAQFSLLAYIFPIGIYLDYLTTCVHYNSLHRLCRSLFSSSFVAIHSVVCTWTCNDKFYWKVSLTRIFISSSQQRTALQHNENRMRWSEFLCNRHLKKNHSTHSDRLNRCHISQLGAQRFFHLILLYIYFGCVEEKKLRGKRAWGRKRKWNKLKSTGQKKVCFQNEIIIIASAVASERKHVSATVCWDQTMDFWATLNNGQR